MFMKEVSYAYSSVCNLFDQKYIKNNNIVVQCSNKCFNIFLNVINFCDGKD